MSVNSENTEKVVCPWCFEEQAHEDGVVDGYLYACKHCDGEYYVRISDTYSVRKWYMKETNEQIQVAPLEHQEVSMRTPETAFEEWFNLNLNARKNSQTLYHEWEDKKELVRNVFLTGYQTAVTDRESSVFYSGAFAE